MNSIFRASMQPVFFACAVIACGAMSRAQQAPAPDASGTVGAPAPERMISPKASAAITAGFKYAPPPPPKPVEDEDVDLRDVDKPQNEIVRLPKYTVTVRKPAVFNDRNLYTQEQLRKLAVARYIGKLDSSVLNRWTIPGLGVSNEQRAMDMYLADERLKNMAETKSEISLLRATGENERADQAQTQYYDMFLRRRDYVEPASKTHDQGR